MRHRGIEVGEVAEVRLDEDLSGIVVRVRLDRQAARIATEGSQFWIVRPRIDLTGVSGLETAVGAKYVAVLPSMSGDRKTAFEGLASQPADSLGTSGIEIVLRGDDRYGVNPGSPVLWRGVEVGQVLSTDLSPDTLHVDTRIEIRDRYRRLLSRESKFWVLRGLDMELGVTGLSVSAGTLDTITRGAIGFITPGPRDGAPARGAVAG